jgi:hypothetical protein
MPASVGLPEQSRRPNGVPIPGSKKRENAFYGFYASRRFLEYSKMPGKRSQEWPQSRILIASDV